VLYFWRSSKRTFEELLVSSASIRSSELKPQHPTTLLLHNHNYEHSSKSLRLRRQHTKWQGKTYPPCYAAARWSIGSRKTPWSPPECPPSLLDQEANSSPLTASSTAKTASHTTSVYSKKGPRSTSVNGTKYGAYPTPHVMPDN
jgi:hypothetical protein